MTISRHTTLITMAALLGVATLIGCGTGRTASGNKTIVAENRTSDKEASTPSADTCDNNFTVYTNYDSKTNFNDFKTYCLPDSILLIGQGMKAEYWKDENAQEIIKQVADEMDTRGYTRVKVIKNANIGLQLSFTRQTTQIIGTGGWYGGGWYNGWWGPGYWGPYWNDWYYPYPVTYSYNTGTLIMEMVNLTDHPEDTSQKVKLPVIWHSYATGLLFENSKYNMQLTLDAVNQAFDQSPYIKKS